MAEKKEGTISEQFMALYKRSIASHRIDKLPHSFGYLISKYLVVGIRSVEKFVNAGFESLPNVGNAMF